MNNKKKQIIIIGAGFAGLKLARTLNHHPGPPTSRRTRRPRQMPQQIANLVPG